MKQRLPQRCQSALAALTVECDDVVRELRLEQHREGCLTCAAAEVDLGWLVRTVRQTDDALDELSRARVWSRLARLPEEAPATTHERVPYSWRRILLPAAAAAALLLLLANLLVGLSHRERQARPSMATTRQDRRILLPLSVSRSGAVDRLVGHRVGRLELPAGTEVRARLGQRARLVLVGPAAVEVVRAEPDDMAVRLSRGTLVASFNGDGGGRLTVLAPGVVTEVVGTLFMVRVPGRGEPRVAVAHGRVRVRSGPRASGARAGAMVGDLQSWSAARGLLRLSRRERRLFAQFERREPPRRERRLRPPRPSPLPVPEPSAVTNRSLPDATRPAAIPPSAVQRARPPGAPGELYRRAERAMRDGDADAARQLLLELVRRWKGGLVTARARYELAHLALGRGCLQEARVQLDNLLTHDPEQRLEEPARFLRCQVDLRGGDRARARVCLEAFRARYPGSPHDETALSQLMRLARGDCLRLRGLAGQYLARHPGGRFVRQAHLLRQRCR